MSGASGAPALYFPVERTPLRMQAGLRRFATDFGNGLRDTLHFQRDGLAASYLRAKHEPALRGSRAPLWRRHRVREDPAHAAILDWLRATLAAECPAYYDARGAREPVVEAQSEFDALLRGVQEDAVVLARGPDGRDAATMLHVCFPSGWRPERLLGASFREIHAPVPGFADDDRFAMGMVKAMIEHGTSVRFVWTLCADDALDRHPDESLPTPWGEASGGWLRVERQVTVGFPEQAAALFLIRTYLYAFRDLDAGQRADLAQAIAVMPAAVKRYKGIAGYEAGICRLLARADLGAAIC